MNGMDDFLNSSFLKEPELTVLYFWYIIKNRTGGSLQIQITANIGLVLENSKSQGIHWMSNF